MSLHGIDSTTNKATHVAVSQNGLKIANYVWDTDTLSWIPQAQGSAGGPSADVNVLTTVGLTDTQLRASPVPVVNTAVNYASRLDEDGTTIYIGFAALASTDSASVWQIRRLTQEGTQLVTKWANGSNTFTNSWANRASLSYS